MMATVITVCIAFANVFVLAKLTYDKIMLKVKQKKAKKFFMDRLNLLRLETDQKLSAIPS